MLTIFSLVQADQVMLEGANEDDRRRLDKAVIEKAYGSPPQVTNSTQ